MSRLNEAIWFWVRSHRRTHALLIVGMLILSSAAIYSRLTSTTEFTAETALQEFRDRQGAADAAPASEIPQEDPALNGTRGAPGAGPAAGGGVAPEQPGPAPQPDCDWVCPTAFVPPEPGVYEYHQCGRIQGQCTGEASEPQGTESFGQLSRPLPRRGQRIISVTGQNAWNNVHIYAEEHREEFDLTIDPSGVYNHRYKVDVKLGPVSGGSDIRQEPPLRFSQWPMSLGLAWSGSWTDANRDSDADYACGAVGKEELIIGGQAVRTWVVECRLALKGPKTRGDVFLKFWMSPEYRNTVQELYDQDLNTPQGPYRGRWMVTLAGLTPKR